MEKLPEYIANHPWLTLMVVVAAALVIIFEVRARRDAYAGVSPQDLIRMQNQGALVIDLRKPEEFVGGHIGGARRMDSAEMLVAGDSLKKYKEKNLIVYCESGTIGASAARVLAGQGFKQAFNLKDGLAGWRRENLPLAQGQAKSEGKARGDGKGKA
jgi:rhodanese-related sulfurtransferase